MGSSIDKQPVEPEPVTTGTEEISSVHCLEKAPPSKNVCDNRPRTVAVNTESNRRVVKKRSTLDEDSSMKCRFRKNKEIWPCLVRHNKIEDVRRMISKGDAEKALRAIVPLKHLFRENAEVNANSFNFFIDENSHKLLTELTRILTEKELRWRRRGDFVCHQLSTYAVPPNVGKSTTMQHLPRLHAGMTDFSLLGYILHNNQNAILSFCQQCGGKLRSLAVLELSYTGLNNDELSTLLPHLAKLRKLTYLGLRGNRLERSILSTLIKILEGDYNFKLLQRIDLRNNVDISTVPKTMLELLLLRWPPDVTQPTLAELADGTLALEECDL